MDSSSGRVRRYARLGLFGYLLVPALLTLTVNEPYDGFEEVHGGFSRLLGLVSFDQLHVSMREAESFANALIFVPLGLLTVLSFPGRALTPLLLILTSASLGVELVQFVLLPDRTPNLLDVLHNSGGAAVGLAMGSDARSLLVRSGERHVRARRQPSSG